MSVREYPHTVATPLNASSVPERETFRLTWLIRIRWLALAIYLLIFGLVANYFQIEIAWSAILNIFLIGAGSNLCLSVVAKSSDVNPTLLTGPTLVLDVVLLSLILYFCGGYTNPFSLLLLAHVTLAAFLLNARWTWAVFGCALASYVTLFFFHEPVTELSVHHHSGAHNGFSLHLHGMLLAFFVAGVLIVFFVTRMSREIDEQSAQILRLRERAEAERLLSSLATVTAGAAHELATPIATLSLIVDELQERLRETPSLQSEMLAMRQQIDRCSAVLRGMRGRSSELPGEYPAIASVAEIIQAVRTELPQDNRVTVDGVQDCMEPLLTLTESLRTSLHSIIKNALQASPDTTPVKLTVAQSAKEVAFTVRDAGTGMDRATAARVGEPFFTTKSPGNGMGLGIFLARRFAAQVGGELSISTQPGEGTEVTLIVPNRMEM